jgi:hypothetical protein
LFLIGSAAAYAQPEQATPSGSGHSGQVHERLLTKNASKEQQAAFYTQSIRVNVGRGAILIKAPAEVHPAALRVARDGVASMLRDADPVVCANLEKRAVEVAIIPRFSKLTALPELRPLAGRTTDDNRAFDSFKVRGLSATVSNAFLAVSEENILRIPPSEWTTRSVLHHEIGHAVHLLGLPPERREKWRQIYEQALKNELFPGKYARTNEREYFADLTEAYFGMSPYFCTPDQLARIDPAAYDLLHTTYAGGRDQRRASGASKAEKIEGERANQPQQESDSEPQTATSNRPAAKPKPAC